MNHSREKYFPLKANEQAIVPADRFHAYSLYGLCCWNFFPSKMFLLLMEIFLLQRWSLLHHHMLETGLEKCGTEIQTQKFSITAKNKIKKKADRTSDLHILKILLLRAILATHKFMIPSWAHTNEYHCVCYSTQNRCKWWYRSCTCNYIPASWVWAKISELQCHRDPQLHPLN